MVVHASAAISAQKQSINDLNVFPVPDGDTGTNMSLTIGTAAAEAKKKPLPVPSARPPPPDRLRPAAGGPGQFRGHPVPAIPGLCQRSIKEMETADGRRPWPPPCNDGVVRAAYKAVMKPTEGTILTVSRLAAAAASAGRRRRQPRRVRAGDGHRRPARWPWPTPSTRTRCCKKAGVVDAGGKGFLIILQGMLDEMRGLPIPDGAEQAEAGEGEGGLRGHVSDEEITFTFDTVFIVRKN